MVTSVGNSTGQSILTALNAGGGIDANNLATSLVNAEKLPQQNIIDAANTAANTTISSVGKVKSALTSLQTTLTGLGDVKSFQTSAVSSDTSKVTVAFKTGVTPPTFSNSIDVQQIATATTVLLPAVTSQDGSLLGTVATPRTFSLVSGSVQNSVVNGVAMSLPATSQTGTMTINGITTASFTIGTTSLSDNRKAIVAAINAISSQSGVTAVDNADDTKGITLTAGDGRAISAAFIPAGSTESANVTFKDMVAGSSLTLGGLTFTSNTDMTAAQVAAAFANRADGVTGSSLGTYTSGSVTGAFTGTLTGWSTGSVSGSNLTFTATSQGNVTDLNSVATTPAPTVSITQGASATFESSVVNFGSLAAGSSVTVGGLTYTASTAMTAAQVAAAFANVANNTAAGSLSSGTGTFSGTLSGWSSGSVSGSAITFSAATAGNVADLAVASNAASPTVVITNGQSATQQSSSVAFNALAAGNSVTIGGLTLLANTAMSATDVAKAFASKTAGTIGSNLNPYASNGVTGTFSGSLSGWSSGAYSAGNNSIYFTATNAGSVASLTVTSASTAPSAVTLQGASTSQETTDITFADLNAGNSVTIGGLTLTSSTSMTAAQVATAFASRADGVSSNNISPYSDGTSTATFSGSLNGWSSGAVSGSTVRFTATSSGNVNDLVFTTTGATALSSIKIDGGQPTKESSTVTFSSMVSGNSVTIGGLTFTATSTMSASDVANAFSNLSDGKSSSSYSMGGVTGQFTGTLSGWSSGSSSSGDVTFTATSANNVTDLSISASTQSPAVTTTQSVSATNESAAVTFKGLSSGSSVTVAGLTLTASTDMTDVQVAAAFASRLNGATGSGIGTYTNGSSSGVFSGSLAGWSSSVTNGAVVTFSAASTGNVPDLTVSTSMPSPVVTTTQGTAATNEQSRISFTALAAGSALTVSGLTLNASLAMSASQVAAAFASINAGGSGTALAGSYSFSGSLANWSSGAASNNTVVFTASTTGNVADISLSNSSSAPIINTNQGVSGLTAQLTGVNIGQYTTATGGNSIPGTAMSQPIILSPATSTTGTLVINNTSISVTLTSDLVANRTAIVNAINAQTKTTGVTAVNSGSDSGGISLTSASTQAISVSFPSIVGTSSNPSLNPLSSATTGIGEGRVNAVTKLVGAAMVAPTTATSGNIKINGVSIALSLGTDATVNQTNIIAAINAQTANTGVAATANASDTGITLTAADGRAIKTDLGSTLTEAQTGLKKNVLLSVDMTSTSNDTLTTLRDKINAVSGMSATIVQGGTDSLPLYYLSIKSGLGVSNNLYTDVTKIGNSVPLDAVDTSNSVPATDGLLGNYYSTVTLGQDAKISVDGVSITSGTNTFDKAIPNVTITAVGATNGSPVTISSQTNTTALTAAINSLVSGYNQVISTMAAEMAYNATDPTKNGGLANNATARTLIDQLRAFTTQSITGYDGSSHTLADIGVKTNMDGTLTLDSAAFNAVLASNPDLVAAVMASKQSVSDTRLAPGAISSTAKTGVYTIEKQVLPPTVTNTAASATSNATAAVQFYSLKSGSNITVGGLTFSATTDLTAEEVAAAYSSLAAGATSGPSTAKGTYSGTLSGWASSIVSGSKITFTASSAGLVSALTSSGTSLGWTINGEPATLSGNTLTASPTSAAAGISLFIPSDFASGAADGFTATLNYSQGIVERFNAMINDATGTTSSLQTLTDDENKILSDLTTKQTDLDTRMSALLSRYQQQFSTLTALLNEAKSTQSALTDFQTAWSNSLKGN